MSESKLVADVKDQVSRTWDMVLEAAERFGESQWREADDSRMTPVRLVYHIVFAAERYTWRGEADRFPQERKFNLNWVETPVEELPDRATCLQACREMKARTLAWVDEAGESIAQNETLWAWTGQTELAQVIYMLRHMQHHVAELNVELRKRGAKPAAWK